ncbi:MFS transporter [Microbacterium capsulatum]|uniref:MFS transporter n=1 Tax=Microbacterium capsulatum TaxID=3041921 RepID=A0ABU0XIG1_9MICO|nr:MFS transporter [Microbacterium sp. ASV81]MDQ4214914.1 MFS transporter [Microbacterium sp. ASV81]
MSDHAADTLVHPDPTGTKLPPSLRRLFRVAPLASAAAPLAYGITAYFMAIQAQLFDADAKVGNLALINTLSAVAAMLAQPIFGVLSDRTRSRWGARHPWMLIGTAIGTVALVTAGLATNVAMLTVCIMLIQFGYNAWQGPFAALLPDRVPERFRGRYSTGVGLGGLLGAVIGPILASPFAKSIPVGYVSLAGVVILLILLFIALVPGTDNRGEPRKPFSLTAFLSAFWVNPIRHPDFFWGFTGRLLLFGGFYMISNFSLYIAQDYVGLSLGEATSIVPLLGLAGLPGLIIATAVAGPLSDRLGRRKPLVLISGLLIAVGAAIPFVLPSVLGLTLQTIAVTSGFGAFAAVDQALMSSVLPSPEDFGKDLGVLNLAATLPNTVAPVAAGAIVVAVGYAPLFLIVGGIAVLGALAVLPIRSVR